MKNVKIFNELDEATSCRPKKARAQIARLWQRKNISMAEKEEAVHVLTEGGEPEPIIDALFVSCPLCDHRLEAQERFLVAPDKSAILTWQVGSEHYIEAHDIYPPALTMLVNFIKIGASR